MSILFTPYSLFDAPNNNRADHQQENANTSADRKVQHPTDLAVAVQIQHIYRVYLIILSHLMEHGFFLGCCVPDIACGQFIAGAQHEIIVKVDADIGAVLQRSQVVAVVVADSKNLSRKLRIGSVG